ncbi:MAG: TPR end-of-group domain-containing protein [Betaproteobacteria bacterium]
MEFWEELWTEYRELAKSLVGVVFELVAIFFVIKFGEGLIHLLNVEPSCDPKKWIDCGHTAALLIAWVGLTVSFVVTAGVFTYRHTMRRVHDIGMAQSLQDTRTYTAAITSASDSLEPGALEGDRSRAIQRLLGIRDNYPTDRYVSLYLGRLYRANQDFEGAISAASFFIQAKEKVGKLDIDYGDLIYNRACYKALLTTKLDGEPKSMVTNGALDDLEKSIGISRDNADAAKADSDFAALRQNARYRQLTGQAAV